MSGLVLSQPATGSKGSRIPGIKQLGIPGIKSVKHLPGLLAWTRSGSQLWCTLGRRVVVYDLLSASCRDVAVLPRGRGHGMLTLPRPIARFLRRGVRNCLRLSEGGLLVFSDDHSYYWGVDRTQGVKDSGNQADSTRILESSNPGVLFSSLGRVAHGHGPLVQGCCQDDKGVCYYGDYWSNRNREAVRVWRWEIGAANWQEYYRFPAGAVRHVHAVQFDRYSGRVWIATGDRDEESMIGFFSKTGREPELNVVAAGRQGTRAVSLMFTPSHVVWGSDAGRDTDESCNHVFRWSRANGRVKQIAPVGGPVYYSAADECGRSYLTTAVEGSRSETGRRARLWMSENDGEWRELMSWEKDRYPLKLGYGVLWFPQDGARENTLCVSGQGVAGGPGTWILEV